MINGKTSASTYSGVSEVSVIKSNQ